MHVQDRVPCVSQPFPSLQLSVASVLTCTLEYSSKVLCREDVGQFGVEVEAAVRQRLLLAVEVVQRELVKMVGDARHKDYPAPTCLLYQIYSISYTI